MAFLICVCASALAFGRLTGGQFRRLRALPIRGAWLVLLAAGAQAVALLLLPAPARTAGYASSAALAALFLYRNRGLPGAPLIAAGLGLNAVAVAANGAMPVSPTAAVRAGVPLDHIAAGRDPAHAVAGYGTALPWLGDVIPVPLPGSPAVFSVGDCLVAAGLVLLFVAGMHRRDGGDADRHQTAVEH
ncbi:MAG: DUF5317 domain-containing protein [Actinomycetota bacterium]|nr:DUF5317 domain-containing protein [Actinomycetota bacterium]